MDLTRNTRSLLSYHRTMLADATRCKAFREALSAAIKPDSVVLDLGGGSGVLSMYAARLGARRVYCIERGPVIDVARALVRENGLEGVVEVVKGDSREVNLSERANVLVTETIGNVGVDEGIVGLVRDAKARLLTVDANLIPRRLTVEAALWSAPSEFARELAGCADHDQVSFGTLRESVRSTLWPFRPQKEHALSHGAHVFDVDLTGELSAGLKATRAFSVIHGGLLAGIAGWFTAEIGRTIISNSPVNGDTTSWPCVFFPLPRSLDVRPGDDVSVTLQTHDGYVWQWMAQVRQGSTVTLLEQNSLYAWPQFPTAR